MPLSVRSRHVLIAGSTGSLKTYGVGAGMYEALLRDTHESIIRFNVKGPKATREDEALAKAIRPECLVIVFAPGNPERSCIINFLQLARRHGRLDALVKAITESIARGANETEFWDGVTKKNLRRILGHPSIDSLAEASAVLETPETLAAFAHGIGDKTLAAFAEFAKAGPNGSTCFAHIGAVLAPFCDNAAIRDVTSGPIDIDLVNLLHREDPFVFIIECDETTFAEARHAIALVISLFFEAALTVSEAAWNGELPVPVNFLLDELGTIPPLNELPAKANLFRSRGVRLVVFVQSIQQIYSNYGKDAEGLLSAFNNKVFLCSGLQRIDREFASRLTGNIAVSEWRETQTPDPDGQDWRTVSRTKCSTLRPLLSPDDFLIPPHPTLGGRAVVFFVDVPPFYMHFKPAWELPVFGRVMRELAGEITEADRAKEQDAQESSIHGRSPRGTIAPPIDLSVPLAECSDWDDDRYRDYLDTMKPLIAWESAAEEAREWFEWLHQELAGGLPEHVRFAEELVLRKATLQEFWDACGQSPTLDIRAILCLMDTRPENGNKDRW